MKADHPLFFYKKIITEDYYNQLYRELNSEMQSTVDAGFAFVISNSVINPSWKVENYKPDNLTSEIVSFEGELKKELHKSYEHVEHYFLDPEVNKNLKKEVKSFLGYVNYYQKRISSLELPKEHIHLFHSELEKLSAYLELLNSNKPLKKRKKVKSIGLKINDKHRGKLVMAIMKLTSEIDYLHDDTRSEDFIRVLEENDLSILDIKIKFNCDNKVVRYVTDELLRLLDLNRPNFTSVLDNYNIFFKKDNIRNKGNNKMNSNDYDNSGYDSEPKAEAKKGVQILNEYLAKN